jgi:hypothetical protein
MCGRVGSGKLSHAWLCGLIIDFVLFDVLLCIRVELCGRYLVMAGTDGKDVSWAVVADTFV